MTTDTPCRDGRNLDGALDTARDAGAGATFLAVDYRARMRRRIGLFLLLAVLALAAMVADLLVGSGTLSLSQVLAALRSPATADPTVAVVVWDIRAPVTCLAALTGIQLALSGSALQTALNNPLAEPFTLGIAAAAGFGAALAIVFESSPLAVSWLPSELFITGNAFLLALLAMLLVAMLAKKAGLSSETVTLLGITVHFTFSALLAFAQYFADPNQLQALVYWLLGSLQRATWMKVGLNGGALAIGLPLLLGQAWALTALRGYGDQAVVLGIKVERLRMMLLATAALMAGAATASVGVVGFVGLVAPHMARLLVGEDQRLALPVTAVCGMLVLTLASLASKTILPGVVLPIGMVTSLLGIPFFLAQILSRRSRTGH